MSLWTRLGGIVPAEALDRWDGSTDEDVPLVAPARVEEFQAVLRLAHAEGLRVLPLGLGSKLGWMQTPSAIDLVLSTRRHRGVTSYEPGDGTVTARAGTPMGDLAAVVGEGGHSLSPAVPVPEESTLGGVVAAGQSGDDRMRYGPLRDNLLGTRVLLPDGTLVKSGGQLVKNVTGYDLHRLFCGSFGSLCLILEASLRLHPLPEERALFLARAETRQEALDLAAEVRALPVRPVTLLAHDLDVSSPGKPWTVFVVLAGRPEVVEAESERLRAIRPDASFARGSEVAPVTRQVRDLERTGTGWPPLSIETRPSRLGAALDGLEQRAAARGYAVRTLIHPTLARIVVWLLSGDSETPVEEVLDPERIPALDADLRDLGVVARWRDLPAATRRALPVPGVDVATGVILDGLRTALDPTGVFAPRPFEAEVSA